MAVVLCRLTETCVKGKNEWNLSYGDLGQTFNIETCLSGSIWPEQNMVHNSWSLACEHFVTGTPLKSSDNGLSPRRRQAIIWTNEVILSVGPLGTNFIEILIEIQKFSFKKMQLKMSVCEMAAILSRPHCGKLFLFRCGYCGNKIQWASIHQGSFCLCAQPMRNDVTMKRRVSLAGRTPRHPVLLSGEIPYRQISWSLGSRETDSFNAALLPRCLANFRTIGKV